MLVSDIVARVSETLQDQDQERYTEARIIAALNLGILDTRRSRPDLFIGRFAQPTPQLVSAADEFPLPEIIIPPLIAYAIGWIEMGDEEYADDGRAAAVLKKFSTDLGVP